LIMWIPAGVTYIIAGLALFAGWLREAERRAENGGAAFQLSDPALGKAPLRS
jgi:hypothetical protein